MNNKIKKLESGDIMMVISPSESLNTASPTLKLAKDNFKEHFGVKIQYSKNSDKINIYKSSSIKNRIDDLHNAFKDPHVKAIICVSGGYNVNEILKHIDWDIIKNNPKPIIGSSDITVLLNSIYRKTGVQAYYGPNYFKFGMKKGLEYNLEYFGKCLLSDEPYDVVSSKEWSNDKWYKDQDNRIFHQNNGYQVINEGSARGIIIGGNLCSLNLLQGTEFMPKISNSILLLEDDDLAGSSTFGEFNRNLQSLLHLPGANSIKGIIIGRFQPSSEMDLNKIEHIIHSKEELKGVVVIANADFGHTDPMAIYPIGGTLEMNAKKNKATIKIVRH